MAPKTAKLELQQVIKSFRSVVEDLGRSPPPPIATPKDLPKAALP